MRTLAYSNTAAHITEAGALLDATDAMLGTGLHGDDDLALDAAYARGVFHFQQLQIEPAMQAYRRADRLQRLLRPDDALMAATIRENLADGTLRQGDLAGAVAQLRAMLADPLFDARRIGEGKAAGHRIMLARALRNLGRYDEALPLAEAAAAATGRILGPDDYTTLVQLSTVASIHDYAGRCGQALEIARVVRTRMAAQATEYLFRQPAQLLSLSFLGVILAGTLVLSFPYASATGVPVRLVNALFTATSATCVTGLTVLDTPRDFSLFGQFVILALIQIGGLGIMTMGAVLYRTFQRRVSMRFDEATAIAPKQSLCALQALEPDLPAQRAGALARGAAAPMEPCRTALGV